jgi:hypothetical protein
MVRTLAFALLGLGVLLFIPLLIRVAVALFMRFIMRSIAKAVGDQALAEQPDQIHLEPADSSAWQNPDEADQRAGEIGALGFEDAGAFTIAEMPGVVLRLMTNADQSIFAAYYQHPQAGSWFEFVTRYQDGSGATFSTIWPTGLDPRPGSMMEHAPGSDPDSLYQRALAERPQGGMRPASAETAAREFENAYAEEMTWRKNKGITPEEVVEAAMKEAA